MPCMWPAVACQLKVGELGDTVRTAAAATMVFAAPPGAQLPTSVSVCIPDPCSLPGMAAPVTISSHFGQQERTGVPCRSMLVDVLASPFSDGAKP